MRLEDFDLACAEERGPLRLPCVWLVDATPHFESSHWLAPQVIQWASAPKSREWFQTILSPAAEGDFVVACEKQGGWTFSGYLPVALLKRTETGWMAARIRPVEDPSPVLTELVGPRNDTVYSKELQLLAHVGPAVAEELAAYIASARRPGAVR